MSDTKSSSANETGHVVSKYSLQALANRIAALEAQNALLRAVAEAALPVAGPSDRYVIMPSSPEEIGLLAVKLKAAIDGGALSEESK